MHRLEKIDEIEGSGLRYQQHGVSYQNPHYDMSFVLKNLNADEFRQLQRMVGQSHSKIQHATRDNYKNISFMASDYEALKKVLARHKPCAIRSFFYISPATILLNKLQFDFHSLITALDTYVSNYDRWGYHEREIAWLKVGKAQRDVPAQIAHEYCRPYRSFDPRPEFNEETLPRSLTFDNFVTNAQSWFPLTSSSSGLGFDFSIRRGRLAAGVKTRRQVGGWLYHAPAESNLAACRHLDEVRIADLTVSRNNLCRSINRLRLARSLREEAQS